MNATFYPLHVMWFHTKRIYLVKDLPAPPSRRPWRPAPPWWPSTPASPPPSSVLQASNSFELVKSLIQSFISICLPCRDIKRRHLGVDLVEIATRLERTFMAADTSSLSLSRQRIAFVLCLPTQRHICNSPSNKRGKEKGAGEGLGYSSATLLCRESNLLFKI